MEVFELSYASAHDMRVYVSSADDILGTDWHTGIWPRRLMGADKRMQSAFHLAQLAYEYRVPAREAWRKREHERLDSGTYTAVPHEFVTALSAHGLTLDPDHFAHLPQGNEDPNMIAWTENEKKAWADVQQVGKVGKYLRRYYGDSLSDQDVEELTRTYRMARETENQEWSLEIARDQDTISEIFETELCAEGESTVSCMQGKFAHRTYRPYHVYADSPDVAIGYVRMGGRVIARSVLNMRDKCFVRVYASEYGSMRGQTVADKFEHLLEQEGYVNGDLEGCRLTNVDGGDCVPYLDGDSYYLTSDFTVTSSESEAEYECQNTDGTAEFIGGRTCWHCDERYSEDEVCFVGSVHREVCDYCLGEHYVFVAHEYFAREDCALACDGDWNTRDELTEDVRGNWHVEDCECFVECEVCADSELLRDVAEETRGVFTCPECVDEVCEDCGSVEDVTGSEGPEGPINRCPDCETKAHNLELEFTV